MSVQYNATVNLVNTQGSSLRAFATVFVKIDDEFTVALNGFRVIEGSKGIFVTPPQTKANKPDENGKFKYYNDIRFLEEDLPEGTYDGPQEKAAKDAVLEAYGAAIGTATRGGAASAQANQPQRTESRPTHTPSNW